MILKLTRTEFNSHCTIGKLFVDGKFLCYTLEDTDRHLSDLQSEEDIKREKVYCKTAIPWGTYEVIINMSNRFKKEMPLLLNVKGFEGIRIHAGNTNADTCGCILLGKGKSRDMVTNSRAAWDEFMELLKPKLEHEKVMISVG